jgi:hypothetical protein
MLEIAARSHAKVRFDALTLENELRHRPEVVDGWLRWSEDKRWSPAWYFSIADDDSCVVGYYSTDETRQTKTIFDNPFNACAAFIIHELEDYRLLQESKGKW